MDSQDHPNSAASAPDRRLLAGDCNTDRAIIPISAGPGAFHADSSGYAHRLYALSLAEFGSPMELPRSGGWLLRRAIPGMSLYDAMGCYPLFACRDWSGLNADLSDAGPELVSLGLVADPFAHEHLSHLERCFDSVRPFKEHYIVDFRSGTPPRGARRHREYARAALKVLSVEICPDPSRFEDQWVSLYTYLVERHRLSGIKAFSPAALRAQLRVPGMVMFRATCGDETAAMLLCCLQDDVAFNHLQATSPSGYELRAAYALYSAAIEWLSTRVGHFDLGGGAGISGNGSDGLSQFKRGWSTGSRPAFFCSRVFNSEQYDRLVLTSGRTGTDYFPAYRAGEMA
jgi:hypothetical protein